MKVYIESLVGLATARPLIPGKGSVIPAKHAVMWIEHGLLWVQLIGKNSQGKTEPLRCFHPAGVELFPMMVRDENGNQTDVPWTPQAEAEAKARANKQQQERRS